MEINVAEAKDQFSRCLAKAQAGETVIVRKHGKAIAQITGFQISPRIGFSLILHQAQFRYSAI